MRRAVAWISPAILDDLVARYPSLARADIALVLEEYWPRSDEVEAALRERVATRPDVH